MGYDHAMAVSALIDAGANVNTKSVEGVSVLHWACLCKHTVVVELLLDAQADTSVTTPTG